MSCKGNTELRQNAGRYPTSIALRFYIWIADTKVCFCALSAARRQRPAMRPGTRCPPAPPRPIPPAISRPAAGIFLCRAFRPLPAARWRRRHQHRYHQHGDIGSRQLFLPVYFTSPLSVLATCLKTSSKRFSASSMISGVSAREVYRRLPARVTMPLAM